MAMFNGKLLVYQREKEFVPWYCQSPRFFFLWSFLGKLIHEALIHVSPHLERLGPDPGSPEWDALAGFLFPLKEVFPAAHSAKCPAGREYI